MIADGVTPEEFEQYREFFKKETGITLLDGKEYLIESRMLEIALENACDSYMDLYKLAISPAQTGLKEKIIDAITTNETLWFRDVKTWECIREDIIPYFCKQLQDGTKHSIKIWSAASSTGQEPYSLAMCIHDHLDKNHYPGVSFEQFKIIATDISPSSLFICNSGRYDPLSMSRGMEENMKNKYFTTEGRVSSVNDNIKTAIQFKKFNLMDSFLSLGTFDFILCRNVAIYFSTEIKSELFGKFAKILNPKSYFLLGSGETVFGYTKEFEQVKDKKTLLFKKTGDL